jgi:hypothetical protein
LSYNTVKNVINAIVSNQEETDWKTQTLQLLLSKWTLAVRCPCTDFCSLYMSGDGIYEDILPSHDFRAWNSIGMFSGLLYWRKTDSMGSNGGNLYRWRYIYGGTAGMPLHFSYECVSLCNMDPLNDTPRAKGDKSGALWNSGVYS